MHLDPAPRTKVFTCWAEATLWLSLDPGVEFLILSKKPRRELDGYLDGNRNRETFIGGPVTTKKPPSSPGGGGNKWTTFSVSLQS